jgi:Na+-translocating ferredoxin:NAD+ oxidoreductase RNF subunit RnfB
MSDDAMVIVQAILILGGTCLVFAIFIAGANKKLKVWEDPRIDVVASMLPSANCGACGLPGCRAFAEKAVVGEIQPAKCTVSNADRVSEIAHFLGVDAGQAIKRVARLQCAGGSNVAAQRAEYRGLGTCEAAAAVAGGGKGCAWGCLGLADCARACTFDAITMNPEGLPVVDVEKCTACNDCVVACPKNLFVLQHLDHPLLVQCMNLVQGDVVLDQCSVACTTCGKCVLDAAPGLISVASGVAVIDYSKIAEAEESAVERCPTGAIVWLRGAQFARQPALSSVEAA